MLEKLKKDVCDANLELVRQGIVIYTWGNVSGIDRITGNMVIKPSGLKYSEMKPDDMVVVNIDTGKVVEGKWNPSSDTLTHLEIYKNFPEIGGIAHTHSTNAVAFAQAGMYITALGTTHADYFLGDIPCSRELTEREIEHDYEKNVGKVIVETIDGKQYSVMDVPGVLVKNHGPFAWGKTAAESVYHATIIERIAEINYKTLTLNKNSSMSGYLLDKHYKRKHGVDAYYGQSEDGLHGKIR